MRQKIERTVCFVLGILLCFGAGALVVINDLLWSRFHVVAVAGIAFIVVSGHCISRTNLNRAQENNWYALVIAMRVLSGMVAALLVFAATVAGSAIVVSLAWIAALMFAASCGLKATWWPHAAKVIVCKKPTRGWECAKRVPAPEVTQVFWPLELLQESKKLTEV